MYLAAYMLVFLAFLASAGCAAWIVLTLAQGRSAAEAERAVRVAEWVNSIQCGFFVLASGILLNALIRYDFSVSYVYSYTDRLLPLFYRVTAFWGGQEGSLLFWALCVVLVGLIFQLLPRYAALGVGSRLWYWLLYLSITAFFGILLITWSNPFAVFDGMPADGRGLNPLLQHPGMIFHPPLLFLGYAGFVIPACMALAQAMSRGWSAEEDWSAVCRPFVLISWALLGSGILLGAWWSYMELGWGGYWAWDPVENSSLIPWLISTALLHTLIIQVRRNKLHRINILLAGLTLISTFFATYLVRSGVLQNFSLHSFSDGGVGLPLLIFVALSCVVTIWCACFGGRPNAGPVESPSSREGFLVLTVWTLMALSLIVLLATLWPVLSAPFGKAQGLEASFYNRVCLPLFTLLTLLLVICPWLRWDAGVRDIKRLSTALGVLVATTGAFFAMGYTDPVACLTMAASVSVLTGCALLLTDRAVYRHLPTLSACGVHLGTALIILGVAFSGPYKQEEELVLSPGQTAAVGPFAVKFERLDDGRTEAYGYVQAVLHVERHGKSLGEALPERRFYFKWQRNFAEAYTIPSLGSEFYASLLAVDEQGRATLRLSANPLINWIWIGSVLICFFPFFGLMRRKRKSVDAAF